MRVSVSLERNPMLGRVQRNTSEITMIAVTISVTLLAWLQPGFLVGELGTEGREIHQPVPLVAEVIEPHQRASQPDDRLPL
jgi:hypothetical protein